MKTIIGTCHFVSYSAAVAYYSDYFDDALSAVQRKIDQGEIKIGKPEIVPGQHAYLIDNGRRWAIVSAA